MEREKGNAKINIFIEQGPAWDVFWFALMATHFVMTLCSFLSFRFLPHFAVFMFGRYFFCNENTEFFKVSLTMLLCCISIGSILICTNLATSLVELDDQIKARERVRTQYAALANCLISLGSICMLTLSLDRFRDVCIVIFVSPETQEHNSLLLQLTLQT